MQTPTFTIEQMRFPLGRFEVPTAYSLEMVHESLAEIAALPTQLAAAVADLDQAQLDTPYRPGGWTIRQVVHHLPDSHMNSYIRFRLALTEEKPVVRPYDELMWAQLPDAKEADPAVSVQLLAALHQRWGLLLQSLASAQWHRTFVHPEGGNIFLFQAAAQYAWHGKHHLAHITFLKERMGW